MILNESALTLDRLTIGKVAVVQEVVGDAPEFVRLRVMGVCGGQGVHVLRSGPRMVVCVGGTRLGIDRQVAACVEIVEVDPSDPVAMQEAMEAAVQPDPPVRRMASVRKEMT